ncbi:MAG: UDP-N-acetylmuramoyl-L-alanine--D-glutamate ligase [Candidatus Omnitrophica bacterium]|nr:UDP-N-acetylmuramoyl-L-alanine--D-glutamate ligase [Candidatus Omnitrophota bacterium]
MLLKKKTVTVIGLSESGMSAAKLLQKIGARVRVSEISDTEPVRKKIHLLGDIECELGKHTDAFIDRSDIVVTSPGVPADSAPLRRARARSIPVIGEIELGYMYCRAPIIAVTGSNGKSTTATMIHHILRFNKLKSHLLGNIGKPFCGEALSIKEDAVVVLEVSSFQLETIGLFKPYISVLLNITEDHLDRYDDMRQYTEAKSLVFKNQDSNTHAILNRDNENVMNIAKYVKSKIHYYSTRNEGTSGFLKNGKLFVDVGKGKSVVCKRSDIPLPGMYNIENVLASSMAAKLIRDEIDIAGALPSFRGLRHRFELVRDLRGIKFVDDSKSTTVDSTLRALETFRKRNVILIAGGKDKGGDYSILLGQIGKIKHMVLIGQAKDIIRKSLGNISAPVQESEGIEEAVEFSNRLAKRGDTVLLSPMCSSYDMFQDYKERGDAFRRAVGRLK